MTRLLTPAEYAAAAEWCGIMCSTLTERGGKLYPYHLRLAWFLAVRRGKA